MSSGIYQATATDGCIHKQLVDCSSLTINSNNIGNSTTNNVNTSKKNDNKSKDKRRYKSNNKKNSEVVDDNAGDESNDADITKTSHDSSSSLIELHLGCVQDIESKYYEASSWH